MCKENPLCKKFLLSADWDRAVAALPEKDKAGWSAGDYANRAYARCFQATNAHKNSNYDDAVEDASQALLKDCRCNRSLGIRAYAYYLNNNYEAAITDCERVIERTACDVNDAKEKMRRLWEDACKKIKAADEAKEKAEAAKKDAQAAGTAVQAAAQAAADAARTAAEAAQADADTAVQAAADAQEAYCAVLRPAAFANELLGMMYSSMGNNLEASKCYKLALLAHQTVNPPSSPAAQQPAAPADEQIAAPADEQPAVPATEHIDILASPLLMDAYRNARAAIKSTY
jgi:hypothetical protein